MQGSVRNNSMIYGRNVLICYISSIVYFSAEDSKDVQHTFFYQLIMEKDEQLLLPTTQQLFELSFLQLGIKLKEV